MDKVYCRNCLFQWINNECCFSLDTRVYNIYTDKCISGGFKFLRSRDKNENGLCKYYIERPKEKRWRFWVK